jgi:hypothetical protein
MKYERYRGQVPLDRLQKDYFLQYNPNYWVHKVNALLSFIENPATINTLKFEGDNDSDEVISLNLKMELHMAVFHSSEALFSNVFSIVFMPSLPWIWTSSCRPKKLYKLIETVGKEGLSKLAPSPEIWLRNNLYPAVGPDHANYEKTKLSATFVVDYLKTLANEFLDHSEYNSYKHGLRSFIGKQKFQAINEKTQEIVAYMESDIINFLEFEEKDKSGKPYIDKEDGQPYIRVKLVTKSFDYKRDCMIVRMNSAILTNLFYTKAIAINAAANDSRTFGYHLLDEFTLEDIFGHDPDTKGTGVFKRFTI